MMTDQLGNNYNEVRTAAGSVGRAVGVSVAGDGGKMPIIVSQC